MAAKNNLTVLPLVPPDQLEMKIFDARSYVVKKPVEAIHMATLGGIQTKTQRLAWNAFLKHANTVGMQHAFYTINRREFINTIGYKSRNTEHLKKTLMQMQDLKAQWNYHNKAAGDRWMSTVLVDMVSVDKHNIRFSFSPHIKSFLFDPQTYANLDLRIQRALRLDCSAVLYEWCIRYRAVNKTCVMPWLDWRKVLFASDEYSGSMTEYSEFRRKKLRPAVDEINALTDLQIQLVENRDGNRKVTSLQFLILEKPQFEVAQDSIEKTSLEEGLAALGFTRTQIRNLFNKNAVSKLQAHYDNVLKRSQDPKQKPIKDLARYYKFMLDNVTPKVEQPVKPVQGELVSAEEMESAFQHSRTTEASKMYAEMDGETQDQNIKAYNANASAPAQIPEDITKRTNRFMIPFYSWLSAQTWGTPTTQELFAFALNATKKNKNT